MQLLSGWEPGVSRACLRWQQPSTWHWPKTANPKWPQVEQLLWPLKDSNFRSSTKPHSSIKLTCSTSELLHVRGDRQRVQSSVVTSTSNRTAPSGLSTLVLLPITLAILVASAEATSNDAADV
ncbi:hypothetical protein Syncc9605_1375 [Synechococcus sp. CC9605]|nr:hypothetical protein Syncc9605_1375 [Synechococcus sp. CC9605]